MPADGRSGDEAASPAWPSPPPADRGTAARRTAGPGTAGPAAAGPAAPLPFPPGLFVREAGAGAGGLPFASRGVTLLTGAGREALVPGYPGGLDSRQQTSAGRGAGKGCCLLLLLCYLLRPEYGHRLPSSLGFFSLLLPDSDGEGKLWLSPASAQVNGLLSRVRRRGTL